MLSPHAQHKLLWILWGIVTGIAVLMLVKYTKGPESLEEVDRQQALKDARRKQVQARLSAGLWKRAEKKAFGLLRLGEQKRKSA